MSTIAATIQSLSPGAILELFVLDLTPIQIGAGTLYFHAGTNGLQENVVWQGVAYSAYPIHVTGFEYKGNASQSPRPKLSASTQDGVLAALNQAFADIVGASLTRYRTFAKYLDAVNFAGGNPLADPTAMLPIDVYYVERKISESKTGVDYELAASFDMEGLKLPKRQVLSNLCWWNYRTWNATTGTWDYTYAGDCGYTGPAVADIYDNPTTSNSLDNCSRTLNGCKLRFGNSANGLPFGGFPGAGRYNSQ
jgi:lambda family phage minor tail protein L